MPRIRRSLVLGACVLIALAGCGERVEEEVDRDRWRRFAEAIAGDSIRFDYGSVLWRGDSVAVWVRRQYGMARRGDSARYDQRLERLQIDCRDRRYRVREVVESFQGALRPPRPDGDPEQWHDIPPESLGEALWETLCQHTGQPRRFPLGR